MKRILIIDDDRQICKLMTRMLERAGYEVETATDGQKGVMAFHANASDLVITDLIMPDKEGVEVIMELRQDFPDLPIIAMSGGARIGPNTYLKLAKKLGAAYTLTKPISQDTLLTAIKDLIGTS